MRDFKEITKEIKLYIAKTKSKKILDKDVADMLSMSQANFATLKKRNSIPYKQIIEFCYKEELCSNEVFFKS